MVNLKSWNYYYNLEGSEEVRANLVYTPYISPDKKTLCMSFNRDVGYHKYDYENVNWTDLLLDDRFNREVLFHSRASKVMPTLDLIDIDATNRNLYFKWYGDDFYMQGLSAGGYDKVLFDWQQQWQDRVTSMWNAGFVKCSLHPNSWVAVDGTLIPFNWFFCYDTKEEGITIKSLLVQISNQRQDKLFKVLENNGVDINYPYSSKELQRVAFDSFRSNYPAELIDNILKKHDDLLS